ncbi:hypothetical protein K144316041_p21720 (plasmid) [Clostridium tetani]|uniref:hypothetical protein n=1 Tax=Clostridium tetani TaxID=1513 RepID=UPI00295545F4|nr:hypothetical protein [Clostridium tetani]BDR74333.1 hypothetical protein K144316041_p21720 [Clostridium tetani]
MKNIIENTELLKEKLIEILGHEEVEYLDIEEIEKYIEKDALECGNYRVEDEFHINEKVVKVVYIVEVETIEINEDEYIGKVYFIDCYKR